MPTKVWSAIYLPPSIVMCTQSCPVTSAIKQNCECIHIYFSKSTIAIDTVGSLVICETKHTKSHSFRSLSKLVLIESKHRLAEHLHNKSWKLLLRPVVLLYSLYTQATKDAERVKSSCSHVFVNKQWSGPVFSRTMSTTTLILRLWVLTYHT